MVEIAQYLEVDSNNIKDFKLLERFAYLHKTYPEEEIEEFYAHFSFYILDFKVQKITITEVLYNSKDFMNSIGNNLFFQIIANWFIMKNDLSNQFLVADTSLDQFFIDLGNKRSVYTYLIESSERVIELVKAGKLSATMLEPDLNRKKGPFGFSVNEKASVEALTECNTLSFDEIKSILRRIANDRRFASECKRFIEEKGILNETMQIIASFCNIKKAPKSINTREIYRYYCQSHFGTIYRPFECFEPIGKLTRHEVYFIYLFHKQELKEDLKDALKALKEDEVGLQPMELDCDMLNWRGERSIKASIFDLLLKKNLEISFDSQVFRLLNELTTESYFSDFCQLHAKDIIENRIFPCLPSCLRDSYSIIKHLKLQHRDNRIEEVKRQRRDLSKEETNEIKCSLDTLQSLILFSSQETTLEPMCLSEETSILALIDFRMHKWLTESEKTYLLEKYTEEYDISDLLENFLVTKVISDRTRVFFLDKVNNIKQASHKYSIYCKTNTKPAKISIKKGSEVMEILDIVESAYQIREYFYTQTGSKRLLLRFLEGLKLEELGYIMEEIDLKTVSVEFAKQFIYLATKKYELTYISPLLSSFLDLKKVEVVKQIQEYLLVDVFDSMFIDEGYLAHIELLYSKMLGFPDKTIKKNNDKLLVQIGKVGRYMEKEVYLGNLKNKAGGEQDTG